MKTARLTFSLCCLIILSLTLNVVGQDLLVFVYTVDEVQETYILGSVQAWADYTWEYSGGNWYIKAKNTGGISIRYRASPSGPDAPDYPPTGGNWASLKKEISLFFKINGNWVLQDEVSEPRTDVTHGLPSDWDGENVYGALIMFDHVETDAILWSGEEIEIRAYSEGITGPHLAGEHGTDTNGEYTRTAWPGYPPFSSVSITGPSELDCLEHGTYTATLKGGTPPFSMVWQIKEEGSGTWETVQTGSSTTCEMWNTLSFDIRVRATDDNDVLKISNVIAVTVSGGDPKQSSTLLPDKFTLSQNYPNPFNPVTEIRYQLPEAAHVTLTVYNIEGKIVGELVNEYQSAGFKEVEFDASNLASGIYIYSIKAGRFSAVKRMMLIK